MTRIVIVVALWLATSAVYSQDSGQTRYVDDEISISLRTEPRNDADSLGVLTSGTQVEMLESLGPQSYSRVRTSTGAEGWLPTRFLSPDPAAADLLADTRKELAALRSQKRELEAKLQQARKRLDEAKPAFQLAEENTELKAIIAEQARDNEALQAKYNLERAERDTLITGAMIAGIGVVIGLLLPLLVGRKKRYDEL